MARRNVIIKHLETIKTQERNLNDFKSADASLVYQNPVECLKEKGVCIQLMKIRSDTCKKIIENAIQIVKDKDYTTHVDQLRKSKRRFDIELPPRGTCWEVLKRILTTWKADPKGFRAIRSILQWNHT